MTNKLKYFIGIVLFVLGLSIGFTACGDDTSGTDHDLDQRAPVSGTPQTQKDDTNDDWNRHFLPDHSFVWCLTTSPGNEYQAMSCDWVEYHHRLGDLTEQE